MTAHKSPAVRLVEINRIFNDRLGSRALVKTAEMTERLGISQRQFQTDLNNLRDRGAPVEYVAHGRGYRYTEPFLFSDELALSADEVAHLHLAVEALSQFSHLAGYRDLPVIFKKIHQAVRRWEKRQPPKALYFTPLPRYEGLTHLAFFLKAIEDSRRVEFDYHPFHAPQPKRVIFDPYFLREYDQRFYVGGFSHDADEKFVRTFPLERIVGEPVLAGYFHDKPKDYDPTSYWRDMYGIFRPPGAAAEEVMLRFEPLQGKYFLSKPFFEPYHVLQHSSEGLTVRMHIIINPELVAKLASLGNQVKVLAPESLQLRLQSFFREALSSYQRGF